MSRAPLSALRFALIVVAAVAPGAASATPQPGGVDQASAAPQALLLPRSAIAAAVRRTAVADPDLDGEVTSIEAAQFYETRFVLLDENRDGSIDGPEFVRAVAVRSLYTVDGFSQPRPLAFESVDVDGNGTLTPEEFLRAELLRRSASIAGGVDGRRRAIFDVVDIDRDGLLSQQEFMDAGPQDFLGSDANGDGKVSIWEFYAATRL
jgi:Ca2+-binding EF-hand superfamily protein